MTEQNITLPNVKVTLTHLRTEDPDPLVMIWAHKEEELAVIDVAYSGIDREEMVALFRVLATTVEDGAPFGEDVDHRL